MFEADALCQRTAVVNEGKIIALDSPETLKQAVKDLSVIELEVFGVSVDTIEALRALPHVTTVSIEDRDQTQALLVHSPHGSEALPEVMNCLFCIKVGNGVLRASTP